MNGSLIFLRSGHCISVKDTAVRAIMGLQESGLVSFDSLLGSYAEVVKRVAGEAGGAGHSRALFLTFVTLKNSQESSLSIAVKAKVFPSKTSLSWHLGLAAHSRGERVCLIEP